MGSLLQRRKGFFHNLESDSRSAGGPWPSVCVLEFKRQIRAARFEVLRVCVSILIVSGSVSVRAHALVECVPVC